MPALLALTFLIFIVVLTPADRILIGPDEGYELAKGLLISQGFSLYDEVWTDQPPLHSHILALLFLSSDSVVHKSRIVTMIFACLLVYAFSSFVQNGQTLCNSLIGCFIIMTSPDFLPLSASAMLEIPVIACSMLAVYFQYRHMLHGKLNDLVRALCFLTMAFNVKWTSALFLPCFLFLLIKAFQCHRNHSRIILRVCGLFVLLNLTCLSVFHVPIFSTLIPHLQANVSPRFEMLEPTFAAISSSLALVLFTILGVWDAVKERTNQNLSMVILFATILVFANLNRPFWFYYSLYFSIPIAFFGTLGIIRFRTTLRTKFHCFLYSVLLTSTAIPLFLSFQQQMVFLKAEEPQSSELLRFLLLLEVEWVVFGSF